MYLFGFVFFLVLLSIFGMPIVAAIIASLILTGILC